jgi:hypothetical protein
VANCPPNKDCTAAMGYCMASDHDTRVGMSPQPPQDGRWATFVPVSYKNMTSGEAQLYEDQPIPRRFSGFNSTRRPDVGPASNRLGLRNIERGWEIRNQENQKK